jgi:hypothetical protein
MIKNQKLIVIGLFSCVLFFNQNSAFADCKESTSKYVNESSDFADYLITLTDDDQKFNAKLNEINDRSISFLKNKMTKEEFVSQVRELQDQISVMVKNKRNYDIKKRPDSSHVKECWKSYSDSEKFNLTKLLKITDETDVVSLFFRCSKAHNDSASISLDIMSGVLKFIDQKITKDQLDTELNQLAERAKAEKADAKNCVDFFEILAKDLN